MLIPALSNNKHASVLIPIFVIRFLIVAAIVVLMLHACTKAHAGSSMTFAYEKHDIRHMGFGLTQIIHASGPIQKGDSEKLRSLAKKEGLIPGGYLYLRSEGGDLLEGIKLGELIRELGLNTYIKGTKEHKGYCLSACALSFLGGVGRYIDSDEAIYGVHRFYRQHKNLNSNEDVDAAQLISAYILKYMREMGVGGELYQIMSMAGKDEIIALDKKSLHELNVVNNGIMESSWTVEVIREGTYLRGYQRTVRGENKVTFSCDPTSKQIVLTAGFESTKPEIVVKHFSITGVFVNGEQYNVPMVASDLKSYVMLIFVLDTSLAEKFAKAERVGVYMQPNSKVGFAGFDSMYATPKSKEAMQNIVANCQQ